MRKLILISFAVVIFSCTKEINSGVVNAKNKNAQNAVATADTYLPLTAGTFWKYNIKTDDESTESSKLTVLDVQKQINKKNYQAIKSVTDEQKDTLYYAQVQHDYYVYTNTGMSDADNLNIEILFLKDDAAAGDTWIIPAGSANGFSLRCYGKIIEKNATLTVAGITYKNVIHSYVEIRKPLLFTYIVVNRQDFYTAKNIGIIKNVSDISLPANSTTITNITSYQVN